MTASRLKGYTVRARLVPAAAEPNGNTRRFYNYLDFFTAQTAKPTSRCESGRGLPHSKTLREAVKGMKFRRSWSAAVLCRFLLRADPSATGSTTTNFVHHYPQARPMTKEMPRNIFFRSLTYSRRGPASVISLFPKLGRM